MEPGPGSPSGAFSRPLLLHIRPTPAQSEPLQSSQAPGKQDSRHEGQGPKLVNLKEILPQLRESKNHLHGAWETSNPVKSVPGAIYPNTSDTVAINPATSGLITIDRATIDAVFDHIGSDELAWSRLMTKHQGVRDFFSKWHQKKLDEEAGKISKGKRKHPAQLRKTQIRKDFKRMRKQETSEYSSTKHSPLMRLATSENLGGQNEGGTDSYDHTIMAMDNWEKAQNAARQEQLEKAERVSAVGEVNEDIIMGWANQFEP